MNFSPTLNLQSFKFTVILACIISFVASQRIVLESVNVYACILIYFLAIYEYFKRDTAKANAYLLFSVFASVDIGLIYNSTPSLLRYVLYFTILFVLIRTSKFCFYRIKWFLLFVLIVVLKSIISISIGLPISTIHVISNVFFLFLVFIGFCTSDAELKRYDINYSILLFMMSFFLLGEFVNSLYFDFSIYGYMNYDTTKAFIIFPLFYILCKRSNSFLKFFVLLLTFYILIMYVTRMIVLSTVITIALLYLKKLTYKRILLIIFLLMLTPFIDLDIFNSYKATSSFIHAFDSDSLMLALEKLDPIRVSEQKMFFSRNPIDVVFGSGIGTGYFDNISLFAFINDGMAAFTDEEMASRNFYNFHDVWVDYGYRFGLLFFIIYIFSLIRKTQYKNPEVRMVASVLIVLSFCSFFSTPGLLLITFLFLNLRYRVLISEQK